MGPPRICSGDAYSGVSAHPADLRQIRLRRSPSSSSLAIPKSSSRTCPSSVTSTLEGFRSRCTTRRRMRMSHRARDVEKQTQSLIDTEVLRAGNIHRWDSPRTYSRASHGLPSAVRPASYSRAIFGCVERSKYRPLPSHALRQCGAPQVPRGSFSATGRSTMPSIRSASHTVPMPPLPSSRRSRYGPTVSPGLSDAGRLTRSPSASSAKPATECRMSASGLLGTRQKIAQACLERRRIQGRGDPPRPRVRLRASRERCPEAGSAPPSLRRRCRTLVPGPSRVMTFLSAAASHSLAFSHSRRTVRSVNPSASAISASVIPAK